MSQAVFSIEKFHETYADLEPLYREHYAEMQARLETLGQRVSPYAPRLEEYCKAGAEGWLLTFVARIDGKAVGYCNCYVTQDQHNRDLIATEDAIFVTKNHRTGIGRALAKFLLADLKSRGVKRAYISAVTDLRVGPVWRRMGFKPYAEMLYFDFENTKVPC